MWSVLAQDKPKDAMEGLAGATRARWFVGDGHTQGDTQRLCAGSQPRLISLQLFLKRHKANNAMSHRDAWSQHEDGLSEPQRHRHRLKSVLL